MTKKTVWLGAAVAALAVAGAVFWGVSGGRIVEGPAKVPQAGVLITHGYVLRPHRATLWGIE